MEKQVERKADAKSQDNLDTLSQKDLQYKSGSQGSGLMKDNYRVVFGDLTNTTPNIIEKTFAD